MSERFDRFTERAKKVLVLAQQEAPRFNHGYIGTEHLLLGLIREGEGVAAKVLSGLGVELAKARQAVLFRVGRGDQMIIGDISLTPRAKTVIGFAGEEARRLNHNHVGTEHLLLGLIREGEGMGFAILESLGVSGEQARRQILQVTANAPATPERGPERAHPRDNVVTCRVDDRTLNALDALVETGVHDTRSEAAARLIRAGIEANGALFERVFGTVAEIRRLRDETRRLARDLQDGGDEAGGAAARPPGRGPSPASQEEPARSDDADTTPPPERSTPSDAAGA